MSNVIAKLNLHSGAGGPPLRGQKLRTIKGQSYQKMRTLGSEGGQNLKTVGNEGGENLRSLESAKSTPSRKFILASQPPYFGPNILKSEGRRRGSEEGKGEEGRRGSVREGIQRLEERRGRGKEGEEEGEEGRRSVREGIQTLEERRGRGKEGEGEEEVEVRERSRSSEIIRTRSASEKKGQRSVKIKSSWTCYLDGPDKPVRQVSGTG